MSGRRCKRSPGSSWIGGTLRFFRAGNAGGVGVLANGIPRERRRWNGDGKRFLDPDRKLPAARQLRPGPAGAGISLVAAEALEAPALVRVAGAAAAPVQVGREVVRALHIHIHLFSIRVGALGGEAGADAVYPDPLDSQLFQLPLEVPLLPLQLLDLVQGPALLVLQLLDVEPGPGEEAERRVPPGRRSQRHQPLQPLQAQPELGTPGTGAHSQISFPNGIPTPLVWKTGVVGAKPDQEPSQPPWASRNCEKTAARQKDVLEKPHG